MRKFVTFAAIVTVAVIAIAGGDALAQGPKGKGPPPPPPPAPGPSYVALSVPGLRIARFRKAAAASSLLGSLITRMAWVEAGKVSSRDLRVPLALDGRHAAGARDQIGE